MKESKSILRNILNYTFSLGKIKQIPFKLHWSIIPFFAFIPFLAYNQKMSAQESLLLLLLMILVLICVLLHEMGHAMAAKLLGVKTHDILISPIGGIARLERMPEEPIQEFKIAIAGPLVNLVIASIIGIPILILLFTNVIFIDLSFGDLSSPLVFISLLAISNFALFLFNLVPAFPMDGGRILRAFLASKMPREKATNIASIIGKVLAIIIILLGVFYIKPIASLIGIFVFLMADMENRQEQETHKMRSIFASNISTQNFTFVKMFTTMENVIKMHFDSGENNFIVKDNNNKIVGILYQAILDDAMRTKQNEHPVSSFMTTRYAIVNVQDNLLHVYDELITKDKPLALVMDYGELFGILEKKDLFGAFAQMKNKKINS